MTDAGIWVVCGIGLACGGGYFVIVGLVILFTLLILVVVGRAEKKFLSSGEGGNKNE